MPEGTNGTAHVATLLAPHMEGLVAAARNGKLTPHQLEQVCFILIYILPSRAYIADKLKTLARHFGPYMQAANKINAANAAAAAAAASNPNVQNAAHPPAQSGMLAAHANNQNPVGARYNIRYRILTMFIRIKHPPPRSRQFNRQLYSTDLALSPPHGWAECRIKSLG